MPVEGFVELPSGGKLPGWAWDTSNPDLPLQIEAFDGGAFYVRLLADMFRQDLLAAGKRSGLCHFSIQLPVGFQGQVYIVAADTKDRIPTLPSTDTTAVKDWLDGDGAGFKAVVQSHRLAQALFDRPARPSELLSGAGAFQDPDTMVAFIRHLRADEHSRPGTEPRTDEVPHDSLVRELFLGVLGREPRPSEVATYGQALRSGVRCRNVIQTLMQTPEFTSKLEGSEISARDEIRHLAKSMLDTLNTISLDAVKRGKQL